LASPRPGAWSKPWPPKPVAGTDHAALGQGGEPFLTDQGNFILDCAFGRILEPEVLAYALKRVPGVVEHGLFLGVADMAIVATASGVQLLQRIPSGE
jgi:ribose 5-phosphate isomerase A